LFSLVGFFDALPGDFDRVGGRHGYGVRDREHAPIMRRKMIHSDVYRKSCATLTNRVSLRRHATTRQTVVFPYFCRFSNDSAQYNRQLHDLYGGGEIAGFRAICLARGLQGLTG
jgi:hypothetical protein